MDKLQVQIRFILVSNTHPFRASI